MSDRIKSPKVKAVAASPYTYRQLMALAMSGAIPVHFKGALQEAQDEVQSSYLDLWCKANLPQRALLTQILGRQPTQDEADVASTIIQWLGTSMGNAFITQAERDAASRAPTQKSSHP